MDLARHDKSPAAALCWGNHNKHVHTHNLGECTKRGVQKIVMVKLMKNMEINDDNDVTD